jgi:hypothetical protein
MGAWLSSLPGRSCLSKSHLGLFHPCLHVAWQLQAMPIRFSLPALVAVKRAEQPAIQRLPSAVRHAGNVNRSLRREAAPRRRSPMHWRGWLLNQLAVRRSDGRSRQRLAHVRTIGQTSRSGFSFARGSNEKRRLVARSISFPSRSKESQMSLLFSFVLMLANLGSANADCCACCPGCASGCDCPLCECCGG